MRKVRDSRINGNFDGWDPDTVYELEDGSRWRLAEPYYLDLLLYRPRAVIYSEHGRHYMEVSNRELRVEVIRIDRSSRRKNMQQPNFDVVTHLASKLARANSEGYSKSPKRQW